MQFEREKGLSLDKACNYPGAPCNVAQSDLDGESPVAGSGCMEGLSANGQASLPTLGVDALPRHPA